MKVRSIAHRGLRRLYEDDSSKGLGADTVDKLRKMLTFLDAMHDAEELRALPMWNAHVLTGNRKGVWSLHVTRNRRLTFGIEDGEIVDMNLEDYH
jgi:proteic killer suppression protein